MTRLEKIRSMSAEELAEELMETDYDSFCNQEYCQYHTKTSCVLYDDDCEDDALIAACKAACVNYLNAEISGTE